MRGLPHVPTQPLRTSAHRHARLGRRLVHRCSIRIKVKLRDGELASFPLLPHSFARKGVKQSQGGQEDDMAGSAIRSQDRAANRCERERGQGQGRGCRSVSRISTEAQKDEVCWNQKRRESNRRRRRGRWGIRVLVRSGAAQRDSSTGGAACRATGERCRRERRTGGGAHLRRIFPD